MLRGWIGTTNSRAVRQRNLDLDDATLTTANTVDGVDAEPAADKQPGH